MTVNVLLEVNAKPECLEELKSTFENILPDTRNYDGCVEVRVVGNQDDVLNLILVETWQSRQHYEKYLAWRQETGALEALGALLSQPPRIRYYDDLNI
ncbi:MAG: antibiotic biosynthesis monooxygenase [SAR86 cluster bacterium]|uniref:Antibiotic biosynthesis monooxygenase n=1 Tax=SAR86 cluster bacterium TaxID=2030880 RepID=A0A2A4MKD6_9GAMM|nr:MAG: antibiotic biosynthesis monooxygenase [SAR86 cluster bacterium]